MSESLEDAHWVARCLRGEVAAFEPLVAKYQRVLFAVARRLLGDDEDARDVTQNTFIKAYERLDTYDPERRFFSWIYRIAVNESLNLRRARRNAAPLADEVPVDGGQLARVEAGERAEKLRRALTQLPHDYREVIVLRHFGELSYEAISDATGVPEKTVKSRLFSGRQRLGELMAALEGTDGRKR